MSEHTPGPWFVVNDGTNAEPFMSVKAERVRDYDETKPKAWADAIAAIERLEGVSDV